MYYFTRADWSKTKTYDILYDLIAYYTVLIILPVGTLIFCTFKLIKALRESRRIRDTMAKQETTAKKSREDITLSLIVVVIIYISCQILNPSRHIFSLFDDNLECGSVYFLFTSIAMHTIFINCATNFFIFLLLAKGFRSKFKNKMLGLFSCKSNKISPGIESHSVINVSQTGQNN